MTNLEPQVASQMPLPPVLVRMSMSSRPLQWVDPTPLAADALGHSWTFSVDEPLTGPAYCALCCEDYGSHSSYAPCEDAGLLHTVNERRTLWIDVNRVNPENIR